MTRLLALSVHVHTRGRSNVFGLVGGKGTPGKATFDFVRLPIVVNHDKRSQLHLTVLCRKYENRYEQHDKNWLSFCLIVCEN